SYDYKPTTMANFLQRHYELQPFEGLREIEDYNDKYLECVVTTTKDRENERGINRVLFLKASRMISEYENGIRFTEFKPISTRDTTVMAPSTAMMVTTSGITGKLSLLTSFCHLNKLVYIYLKKNLKENK
ncbi:MAG: hypothetical protein K2H92_02240, partial [Bacteroidaceae bacterium]|nr:hypothetical protein [Bacteroidaceae bacterium]